MSDFITLTCPSCGGKLQITKGVDRLACANCGNEHIVKREGGAIFLAPVIETLQNIQVGTDKTASELAIVRLKSEIAEIERIKNQITVNIVGAINDPIKYNEIKNTLASRRKSFIEKIVYKNNASPKSCIHEIQELPASELEHLKSNVTIKMICINLKTIRNFENQIQEKRNQLSRHQRIVSSF